MGILNLLKANKKTKTDIEYIENELKSTGFFRGRQFNPSDEFHIEKSGSFVVKPHGVSRPEAQRALDKMAEGQALRISAEQNSDGCQMLSVRTLDGIMLGDIQWQGVEDLQTIYNILKSGAQVDCLLSKKGKLRADNLKKEIWWCEVSLPRYDVWSLAGADVWTAKSGRVYHCDSACNEKAHQHMTEEEAKLRGMKKCSKCYRTSVPNKK